MIKDYSVIKVLIVDGMPTMRRIIKNILKSLGFLEIDEANDGLDAMKKLTKYSYHLVITDWNMPLMNGCQLIKNIRKNSITSKIPVIIITAEAKKEQIITAAKAGVNGYIVKPFTGATLKHKIDKIFTRTEGC